MNWLVAVLLAASVWGAWNWWTHERPVSVPPGVVAPADPVQVDLDPPLEFQAKDYAFRARAKYEITARVLRKEPYHLDGGANLAPFDLALGWGAMSDTAIVRQLDITQMGRFFYWRPRDWTAFPLSPKDIVVHAAQVHAIPADDEVLARLRRVRPGHVVTLTGYLVDIRGPNGFRWNTSLRRDDTGDGACELMWIREVAVE
ncbi:MAG TPA: hypothetical protein VF196_03175 [Casimicrobiaceae bacterium]